MRHLFRVFRRAGAFVSVLIFLTLSLNFASTQAAMDRTDIERLKPGPDKALKFLRSRIGPVGLVDSFVEDNADNSYTYDNALAAMAFISSGDMESARTILDAFFGIGPELEGGFLHCYNSQDGSPVGILSAGHNAYLLQAMNLYYLKTNDARYISLSAGIANYLLSLQDIDGGIFGRSGVAWKSTENNLGALSAIHNFGILYNQSYYLNRATEIQNFLVAECWDGMRFLCGENDPMIVTDVQALGVLVLDLGYAGGAYWVEPFTLNTQRLKGRRSITGFDLNIDKDTVWIEGTLQQSLAFFVAGDIPRHNTYKSESEKLFKPTGALLEASNKGTTGFGDYFQPWQGVAPTSWYLFVSNQDNVLRLFVP